MTGMGLLENPLESCLQFNKGQWASAEFVTSGSGHGVDLLQRYSGPFELVLPNAVFIGSEILPKWMNKPGRIQGLEGEVFVQNGSLEPSVDCPVGTP